MIKKMLVVVANMASLYPTNRIAEGAESWELPYLRKL